MMLGVVEQEDTKLPNIPINYEPTILFLNLWRQIRIQCVDLSVRLLHSEQDLQDIP